jgi:Tol biopolymer transport system component
VFSAAGTLLYSDGIDPALSISIVKIDRRGQVEELPGFPLGDTVLPRLSPDGTRLAVTENSVGGTAASTISVYDLQRGALTRKFVEGFGPLWGADSQSFVFTNANILYWQALENAEAPRELVSGAEGSLWATDISPRGWVVAYYEVHPDTGRDIWTVDIDGDSEPVPFLATAASERSAVFSPDGNWIAYMSDATGQEEVYVREFPAGGAEIPVSIGGGREPRWSADGTEMFYRQGQGMYVVPVSTDTTFRAGDPGLLFEGGFLVQPGGRNQNYDVDADGNFYIALLPEGGERVNVVLNWDRELARLLAGQR